jgi:N-acetylmuramoyl-L-alanine amidase
MNIDHHRLAGEGVLPFEACSKTSGAFAPGDLDTVIIHYTASPNFRSAKNTLMNPTVKASAHILIDRDGTILQMVGFDTIAWHAGRSEYKDRSGFNKYSIGIEIVNAGPIKMRNGEFFDVYNIKYPADQVMEGKHRNRPIISKYWHTYTPQQLEATEKLCRLLVDTYGIKYILGHEEISVGRKFDPGPAFPLDDLRQRIFSNEAGHAGEVKAPTPLAAGDAAFVTASSLNIREHPSTSARTVTDPLPEGTKVQVVAMEGDWASVKVEVDGWVNATHIALDNTDDDFDAVVSANTTNIHSIPMDDSSEVADPLMQGDQMQIVQRFENWYHVRIIVEGYVALRYLSK